MQFESKIFVQENAFENVSTKCGSFCSGLIVLIRRGWMRYLCVTWPLLVQIKAYCLFRAKSLPEPVLAYSHLYTWKHISVKFESEYDFLFRKMHLKMLSAKCQPFCLCLCVNGAVTCSKLIHMKACWLHDKCHKMSWLKLRFCVGGYLVAWAAVAMAMTPNEAIIGCQSQ